VDNLSHSQSSLVFRDALTSMAAKQLADRLSRSPPSIVRRMIFGSVVGATMSNPHMLMDESADEEED
jgi:hypothetical protein